MGTVSRLPVLAAVLGLGSLALVAALPRSRAADGDRIVIYDSSGFERRPFEDGAILAGLDNWVTLPFNPNAARITDADSANGRQSVEVRGSDLASSKHFTFPPYEAVGSYRRPVNYAVEAAAPIVVVEADLLLETEEELTDDDFFSMTIAARSGDGETLGEMGISSDGSADVYGFNAAPGDPTLQRTPTSLNRWHHMSIVMDFSGVTTEVSYWLDGEFLIATPTTSTSKTLLRGSLVVYARKGTGGEKRSDYTARFDNFRISAYAGD